MADQVTTSLAQAKVLVMQGLAGKAPRVNAINNHWEVYDNDTQTWVDTGVAATGAKGDDGEDGHSPYINSTGYWVFWNDSTGAWVTTNYKAAGRDGEDGHSPYIGENGHWFAWDENLAMFDDTGISAQGPQGDSYVLTNQDKQDIAAMVLPTVTASDNGKSLIVDNGAWSKGYQATRIPRVAMTSADTTPTLDPNKLYVFPEMASLTPTLNTPSDATIVNEYHFVFTSGATATVLTLPASILQPDGFTVEANMHYEISILEGAMTAQGWAVTA